ncbi:hypothetical protein HPB51_024941 [Rhipicephalus microplus]|uniref:Uncharacterized protein n=1 Tax=Rhipicephalus microplus TaxID=6941 RepID=A0A9J6DDI2_RHIMP|nr:hypothetical protein HPB51_024941 [Rhipicephalus microplus]
MAREQVPCISKPSVALSEKERRFLEGFGAGRDVHKVAPEVNKHVKCDVYAVSLSSLEEYVRHLIATHEFVAEYVQRTSLNNKEPQKKLLEELGTGTVCLDSTHGTTGYQFELTTLLVLDEVGSVRKHIHCAVIANTPSSSDNNDYESPPETASEMSQALHIMESITKLDAATKVSSATLIKAKIESVKQAIVDGEVSEEVVEKANKLFEPVLQLVEGNN